MNVPLEVCEARDPKGLYKLARAGKIKGMILELCLAEINSVEALLTSVGYCLVNIFGFS